ncbi:MAG: hypothetical protein SF028_04640 [Candidatus Sumerlaeia bacterium]|nr:hypothetical protein [Candidatus Sumerlaeia bacterium]
MPLSVRQAEYLKLRDEAVAGRARLEGHRAPLAERCRSTAGAAREAAEAHPVAAVAITAGAGLVVAALLTSPTIRRGAGLLGTGLLRLPKAGLLGLLAAGRDD